MTAQRLVSLIGFGFAVLLLGCQRPPAETPAPVGITDPMDPAQRDSVISYARRLTYDTTHWAYDANLLDPTDTTKRLTVWPEENIHRTRRSTLEGVGRIQLRIMVDSTRAIPGHWANYLPRGESYVWVDRRGVDAQRRDTARAVIIPVNPADPVRAYRVRLRRERPPNSAMARWTPATCWSCEAGYWCRN